MTLNALPPKNHLPYKSKHNHPGRTHPKRRQTVQQLPEHFTIRSLDLGYGPDTPRPPEHLTIRRRLVRIRHRALGWWGRGAGKAHKRHPISVRFRSDPCFPSGPCSLNENWCVIVGTPFSAFHPASFLLPRSFMMLAR